MRLIDADALIKRMEIYAKINSMSGDYLAEEIFQDVIDEIGAFTTIEAEPMKHAHVIVNFDGDTKCSECGCKYIDSSMPYCANCGARIDEPTERENFNE